MKKLIIFVITLGLLGVILVKEDKPSNSSILQANLSAALNLERSIISTCGTQRFDFGENGNKAPLFEGLGAHTFPITTKTEEAQTYFNQGINLTYGFNHTEAHRSFKEASRLSESSPMTWWGQAYALSPNINDTNLDDQRKKEAFEAINKAKSSIENSNNLEKALIDALGQRFSKNNEEITVESDAYRMAMEKVSLEFGDNPDVLTLYAAAIMNTMPWDYWNSDMTPKPNTMKAKEALEKAIELNPNHPGAHHYYIHLTELPMPDNAAKSGDALSSLMPGAGHMVHMPSHAYIRVGRYKDAAEANMKAIKADEAYISQCYSQGIYPLGYYPHNIHFLWSAATLMGDSKTAILAAKKTSEKISIGSLDEFAFMQEFAAIPLQAYVRFGKWNEILTVPYPGDNVKHLKLFWHYARGIAFIRKGVLNEASEELDSIKSITENEAYDKIYASINHSGDVADVAFHVLSGEYNAANGNSTKADEHFKQALLKEDQLTYTEPASWHLPTRHNYGAFLLDQKRFEEAEEIYLEDLKVFRNNGWSMIGLIESYKGQDKNTSQVRADFDLAWQYADVEIERSVY